LKKFGSVGNFVIVAFLFKVFVVAVAGAKASVEDVLVLAATKAMKVAIIFLE
jgi:hypothetical protein